MLDQSVPSILQEAKEEHIILETILNRHHLFSVAFVSDRGSLSESLNRLVKH